MAKPTLVTDEQPEPMTVVELTVDNFKRMRAAHVTPSPTGLVPVRGRNDQGKSSTIASIAEALGAEKSEMPITEGEPAADVVVNLGDLVVKKRWTRDERGKPKAALTIEDAEGNKKRRPADLLKSLRGHFADPVAFLDMKPDEQVKVVMSTLGLDVELENLEERAREAFDKRRDLGRDSDRATKAYESLRKSAPAAPPALGEDLDTLTARLQAANDHNGRRDLLQSQKDSAEARGKDLAEQIKELERRKAEVAEAWQAANVELKALAPPIDVEPVRQAIRDHEEHAEAAAAIKALEEARLAAGAAQAEHATADSELKVIRASIQELLESATFPIEGMAYDSESRTITIDGIPFSQASTSARIKAAAAIAMSGDSAIRILFVRDGDKLDDENTKLLADLAEASGFQVWLEVVDSTREGAGIWVEDGEVFQAKEAGEALGEGAQAAEK